MRMVYKFKPLIFSPFHKPKSSPPLRIADVLLLQDDEEQSLLMADCRGLDRSKPRRIAARLFSGLLYGKIKSIIGDRKKGDDDVAPSPVTILPDSSPERCRKEANFNAGIGCCLLHLIVESKNELQKMTELRIQMESVLQNVKGELGSTDLLVARTLESNHGVEEVLGFNNNLTSDRLSFDQSFPCNDLVQKPEDCLEEMDRLEAELEVELERLQHHLDTGKLFTNPPQETIKESTVNRTTSARSYSISCGEVIDPAIDGQAEDCSDSNSGVSPHELERKLHELVETRQEQQIRELEAALEHAREELREKEKEISWWKDTAHFMSRYIIEPSRLDSQPGEHTHRSR